MKTFQKAWDVVFSLRHFTARRMTANRDENSEKKTPHIAEIIWDNRYTVAEIEIRLKVK